jgi:hypothetical protein
VSLL